jgi:D-3-phosphoglycerate dehydrogenase / 2-oxoglutarate reductase
MYKVLISDSVAPECAQILEASGEISVDVNTGLAPEELEAIIGDYDGLVVRSATKARANIIEKAKNLKVIGRAGAGVDNIDIPAATDSGIVVMNTPGGNTTSTAEHAFSLIMALSRNVAQGDQSIKAGRWDRKKYMGVELRGKTLGLIGLGNIGQVVAQRALAFKMRVIGVDPFISADNAKRLGIELGTLDDVWREADYITAHTPLTDSTRYLINADTLAKCKDGVRIINCARGGIINEADLLAALDSGKVAGAALDVYEKEPPEQLPIVMHEKVICTPHLGASTTEAQDIVAVMVAEQLRDFLITGEVRNAVNMPSIEPEEYNLIKPWINLCSRMGSFMGQIGNGQLESVDITYYGELHSVDTWALTSSALEGLFRWGYAEGVNLINARIVAEKNGIKVSEVRSSEEMNFKTCICMKIVSSDGEHTLLGTLFGTDNPRIARFDEYDLDFVPEGNVFICGGTDRSGIIGSIGTVLGGKGINIARMTWARKGPSKDAVVVLATDEAVDAATAEEVRVASEMSWAKSLQL